MLEREYLKGALLKVVAVVVRIAAVFKSRC